MEIYTCQMANWRKARDLGIPVFDITLKSGDKRFAPDSDLLYKYKAGNLSEHDYTARYIELMDQRWTDDAHLLDDITKHEKLCLMCYCGPGKFCHRHLLVEWLSKRIRVSYQGEIRKDGLEQLKYPPIEDQVFPKRIGVVWDEIPANKGAVLLKNIQQQNPNVEWVVLGQPKQFLSFAHRNQWFVRRFDTEDQHDFYRYCTELCVFSPRRSYTAPISWERQNKPTRVTVL